jgi:hypothetical protein
VRRLVRPCLVLFAVLVAAAGFTTREATTHAAAQPVLVFPSPGSHYASPHAQITLRGVPPAQLGTIAVTGSQSGTHSGHVAADSDGLGGSFLPDRPFTSGEQVTVSTQQSVIGGSGGSFSFTVAHPAPPVGPGARFRIGRVKGDVLNFHSRLDIRPATVQVHAKAATAPGDLFLSPQDGPIQNGPMIVDAAGRLVWFDRVPPGEMATDFRVQRYDGRSVLTWWQGYSGAGLGFGNDVITDDHYRRIATVQAGNGLRADLHEFLLTPRGTALITAFFPVYGDARAEHGSSHTVIYDAVIQEIDVKTGLVLFQWDSLDHVPLSASYTPPVSRRAAFDYFHINSIDIDDDGNLIVSSRNTWAIYKVNVFSGQPMWTLGGKHSSFRMGPGTRFAFQHDAEIQAQNDEYMTLFDDGAGPPTIEHTSRGLKLRLDLRQMTARVAAQYQHSPGLSASFEGNVQQLPGGHILVGWGQQPYFTEFSASGRMLFDGRFVDGNSGYRVYRFAWSATPAAPPAVAARLKPTPTVYASWGGSTNVASWRVLAASSSHTLRTVATARKNGFETAITIHSPQQYVAVQALSASGRLLGTSPTVRAH